MDRSDVILTPEGAPWLADPAAQALCAAFEAAGSPAFFVGGCVRNAVLRAPVSDVDFATAAHPDDTIRVAEAAGFKAIPTGYDHGTITVVVRGTPFEITTFRRDVDTDGRHATVAYSDQMAEDAQRRDFTMNALYADGAGQVYDPVGGLQDALAGRVRFINDPRARIEEDYLRILRFFRFSAWYADPAHGFETEALAAIAERAEGLTQLSRERVGQEMLKLLSAPDPVPAVAAMAQTHVLSRVLPGSDITLLGPLQHLETETQTPIDPLRRLAALGGADVAERLRLSRAQAKTLLALQEAQVDARSDAALGFVYGVEIAWGGRLLQSALAAQPMDSARWTEVQRGASAAFPVQARDLADRFSGPALGAELRRLQDQWLASDLSLTKAELLG